VVAKESGSTKSTSSTPTLLAIAEEQGATIRKVKRARIENNLSIERRKITVIEALIGTEPSSVEFPELIKARLKALVRLAEYEEELY